MFLLLLTALAFADDADDYQEFLRAYADGDMVLAEQRARALLASRVAEHGPEHPSVAEITGDLGAIRRARGAVREGVQLTSRALDLYEATLGLDHPDALAARNNLALMHHQQGRTALALQMMREVEALRRARPDTPPGVLASTLNNLGTLLLGTGDDEGAEALFLEALQLEPVIREQAEILVNLCQIYESRGDWTRYDERFTVAVQLLTQELPPGHPSLAVLVVNDAISRVHRGSPADLRDAARRLRSLEGILASQDPDQPLLHHTRSLLGRVLLSQGEPVEAIALLTPALRALEHQQGADAHLTRGAREWLGQALVSVGQHDIARQLTAAVLDERLHDGAELMGQLSDRQRLEWVAFDRRWLSLWLATEPPEAEATWDTVLTWKGMATQASVRQRQLLAHTDDAALVSQREELARLRTTLAQTSWTEGSHEEAALLAREVDELEAALARQLQSQALLTPEHTSVDELCAALGPDEALVDSLYVQVFLPGWQPRYRVWAVRGGACDRVLQVDLPAAELEAAIDAWRAAMGSATPGRVQTRGEALHERLWAPLAPVLDRAATVWRVPDREIARVNPAALPDPAGGFVLERHHVRQLDHAADLLLPSPVVPPGRALVLADVDYGPTRARQRTRSCAGGTLGDLPGTRAEARAVRRGLRRVGLDATLLTGDHASEPQLEARLPDATWLHVATHGFFGDVSCLAGGGESRAEGWQDPLLRAGLVLAPDGDREGVWTGQEVAAQQLSALAGVVLSACDTGLGTTTTGEGVQGLRRGFKLAGARRLVMSLWAVPDRDTARLMELFYADFDREDPARSLLHAQRTLLAEQRREHIEDPRGWGAFVFVGR